MSKDLSNQNPAAFAPPVSSFGGPVAELIAQEMLSPPTRPGLIATLGRFEILRLIGTGGMGVVLLARDSNTGQDVAIKLIKSDLVTDPRHIHRFVKEAGHMQRLKHRNVTPVLEISERASGPYFVMPYFDKGSVARRIQPGCALETTPIIDIALQVAEALQFAHQRGIIHRDLKPANILLASDGKACLADFGLARTMFNDTIVDVEHQQFEGTAPYMSPGVAAGNAEDTRCDIYAFGALLYEMLTGEAPYVGRAKEVREQILAGPPKPIKARNSRADDGLVTIAEGAMARALRDRYADMVDVVADLQRVKEGKAPVGPRGLVQKVRRIPGLIWIPVALAAIAVLTWLFWPAEPVKIEKPVPPMVAKPVVVPAPVQTPAPVPVPKPQPLVGQNFTVLAGESGVGGTADGSGATSRFHGPGGLAVDGAGNVYVADTGNNTIRKITSEGVVSTLAGLAGVGGSADNSGSSARFLAPFGIAVDTAGNVYVSEFANNTIRKIKTNGTVSLLAGLAGYPGSDNGTGDRARFRNPWGIAVDKNGVVYVADKGNSTIRKISPNGEVSTLAGQPRVQGATDGLGARALFNDPHGIAVDAFGNVYVADTGNYTIRRITPSGAVTTVAGLPGRSGSAAVSRFVNPCSVALGRNGDVYVADAGNSVICRLTGNVPFTIATGKTSPDSIAVDQAGNIYIADMINSVISKAASNVGL